MDSSEINETLIAASEYLKRLKTLDAELGYAEQQIITSENETIHNIITVFDDLLKVLTASLCSRRDALLTEVKKIKESGMYPLLQCRQVISKKINDTSNLIDMGHNLLNVKCNDNHDLVDFIGKSSLLGSLPEVPPLKQVPSLSFQYELLNESDMLNTCKNFGSVIHIPPVQISSLTEKPGAILVEWNAIDNDDHISDVQQYRLQRAFGNLSTEKHLQDNFRDCYIGCDTQYLVKDLILSQDYTFRVSCKFEGEGQWSPWSHPEICSTTLPAFCWKKNDNFILSNENKIASLSNSSHSILFSDGVNFDTGYSIEFTFLECDNNLNNTFVGLFASDQIEGEILTDTESVCVEANGNIYGSHTKKSTRLPPVEKGTKICFACEFRNESKMRINIDSCGKRVTYDWPVESKCIYFGAKLNSLKWKIMID